MKKMKYIAPQVEVIRFDTEEVLSGGLISGTGNENAPETGYVPFGGSNTLNFFNQD